MAERNSWAVSSGGGVISTIDGRHALGSLLLPGSTAMGKRNGRLPKSGLDAFNVTATSPTPDGFVHVAPGHMWTMGTRSIAPYIQTLDAIKDINILATPAHGSLTRWDLIIAQQNDLLHADADNTWTVKQVVGTPSATPADPTVTGSPDYVLIARVVVGPGVPSITNANITQLLTAHTVPLGAVLPVLNQAERDAIAGAYDGMTIWRRDRDWAEVHDGTAWRVQGLAVCADTSDRDSAITNPYNGQFAYTANTGKVYQRHAGAWRVFLSGKLAQLRQTATQTLANQTLTDVTFTTEDWDLLVEHDNATNTARYTAAFDATRELSGGGAFAANGTGARVLQWAKNGAAINASDVAFPTAGAGLATRVPARTIEVDMVAGDYVTLQALQDTGGNLATVSSGAVACSMTVKLVPS